MYVKNTGSLGPREAYAPKFKYGERHSCWIGYRGLALETVVLGGCRLELAMRGRGCWLPYREKQKGW